MSVSYHPNLGWMRLVRVKGRVRNGTLVPKPLIHGFARFHITISGEPMCAPREAGGIDS